MKIKEYFQSLVRAGTIPQEPMNYDAETLKIYIDYLEAENAALRERLDKAVELPSGDRVWFITEDEEGEESYIISKPTDCLTVDELHKIGEKYFTIREVAEMRLTEGGRADESIQGI